MSPPQLSSTDKQLKLLEAKRASYFSRIQRIYDRIAKFTDDVSRTRFIAAASIIDDLRNNFIEIVDQINTTSMEANPEYNPNYDILETFDELYVNIKSKREEFVNIGSNEAKPTGKGEEMRANYSKLPPLELPTFNGDIQAWPIFYGAFKVVIHDNVSLSNSEKMHYLIGRLVGKAQLICSGIPPTAENYTVLWNSLTKKYQDTRALATHYCDLLLNIKPITSATPSSLDAFVDAFEFSTAALRQLNIRDLGEFIFVHIGLKKLDYDTAKCFEMGRRQSNSMPTYDEFTEFIREQARIILRTSNARGLESTTRMSSIRPKLTQTFVNVENNCKLCNQSDHEHLYQCTTFSKFPTRERFDTAKNLNCCVNCLSYKHTTAACKSEFRCRICKRRHHSMLHFEVVPSRAHNEQPSTSEGSINVALCNLNASNINSQPTTVLLATAKVNTLDAMGRFTTIRLLVDTGSQNNFVTTSTCKRLGLGFLPRRHHAQVRGIGDSVRPIKGITNFTFTSRFDDNVTFTVQPLVIDSITHVLPTSTVDLTSLSYLKHIPLADDNFELPASIDGIIGAQLFTEIIRSGTVRGLPGQPQALETSLGFIVMGDAPVIRPKDNILEENNENTAFCSFSDPSIEDILTNFWELEHVPDHNSLSPEDKECEDIYLNTVTRDCNGRYAVALPFRHETHLLGHSYPMAMRRFLSLEKKLIHSQTLKQCYDDVINEYVNKGYLRVVQNTNHESYYIPHHGVLRQDKITSKLRVVLDASAKATSSTLSLNECLYAGNNLQSNLFNILLNVRLFPIVISADVRQMYLQILVHPEYYKYQRILYRFNPIDPIQVFEFTRVCFGMRCSPYLALRTIRQLAEDEKKRFPLAAAIVHRDTYMDDFVSSVESPEKAVLLAKELIGLFASGGFDLVKFFSNSTELLSSIPDANRLAQSMEFGEEGYLKVLGMQWLPSEDIFTFIVKLESKVCTKRSMLSTIARLWDIIGFVAPVILYAKLIIKLLWELKIDWDSTPPPEIVHVWSQFQNELPLLQNIRIPRHLNITPSSNLTIMGFADASEKAYGGVIYVHVSNASQPDNYVHIVCAKSKVAPMKVESLARLELCAALLMSKLLRLVIDTYATRCDINKIFAFSDSTIVLSWIHSSPHRWNTFVANRVSKIQGNIKAEHFYHVPGINNPSDCLSRGLTPAQLINHSLWLNGPPWASQNVDLWPVEPFLNLSHKDLPETKVVAFPVITAEPSVLYTLSQRLSSWPTLLRIVAYILRFARKIPRGTTLKPQDLEISESIILTVIQKRYFADVMNGLKNGNKLPMTFRKLSPFLNNSMLRVGGRLSNANLNYDSKHPILLPSKDHIVDIIIDYYHKKYLHAGPQLLMSLIRQKFWILSARNIIRKRIQLCNICYKVNPKPSYPQMADLPKYRVEQVKPFFHTGVDYAGPINIILNRHRGVRSQKAYICLFVCLSTRAVHLELASDLSTDTFMNAFKRFLSRRGPCSTMHSDCGTNFIGAKSHLDALYPLLRSDDFNEALSHELTEHRIEWKTNPPSSPHFGGIWEANVRCVKTHLSKIIGTQLLTYEELSTVLTQIEGILNSRPLSLLSSDPGEPLALTPAHFLTLTPLKSFPVADLSNHKISNITRKLMIDHMVQQFWKRYSLEYLHTLQSRQKWNTCENPVKLGAIVLIQSDNAHPLNWPLGIIDQLYPGNDGVVRVVSVRTKTGTYKRPVVKLCPLPTQ